MTNCIKRESGIELLRIFAAAGVVFCHYGNYGGIFEHNIPEWNYYSITFLRCIAIAAVNIFIAITGYFLCMSNTRPIGKPCSLLLQCSVYSTLFYTIFAVCGDNSFSIKGFLYYLIPSNWFITLYVVLYFISPYLNYALIGLSDKGRTILILMLLLFFSIIPMCVKFVELIGWNFDGLSTIGRGGNQAGYNLVNFVVLYCIGAYIRLNSIELKITMRRAVFLLFVCVVILWIWLVFVPMNSLPVHMARWYDNIIVIIISSLCIIIFRKMKFYNAMINSCAKVAFTVYLIHFYFLCLVDPSSKMQMSLLSMWANIIGFIVVSFAIAWVMHFLYERSIGRFLKNLDIHSISYN